MQQSGRVIEEDKRLLDMRDVCGMPSSTQPCRERQRQVGSGARCFKQGQGPGAFSMVTGFGTGAWLQTKAKYSEYKQPGSTCENPLCFSVFRGIGSASRLRVARPPSAAVLPYPRFPRLLRCPLAQKSASQTASLAATLSLPPYCFSPLAALLPAQTYEQLCPAVYPLPRAEKPPSRLSRA